MYSDQKMLTRIYYQALLPNAIAILGGTINVFFDGVLVGQRMGDLGIASVNQSLAVYLILCTVGSLVAAGGSAQSAAALGANHAAEAEEYCSLALELAVAAGILICGMGFCLSEPIARLLGSENSWQLVEVYIRITFLGGIFKVLLYIPFFYLRLEGKVKESSFAMLTMAVLNIVLDYVFLFVFDFGIGGAAWASVLATVVACVMSFFFMTRGKEGFRFHPIRPRREMVFRIVESGSPMAANNLFSSLRIICLNTIMNLVGGSSMVAVFAITNNINEFSICVQNGIPQAGSAMLGIYYGEQDPQSVKKLLKIEIWSGFLFSGLFALLLVCGSGHVGLLFGSNMDVRFAVCSLAAGIVIGTFNSVMTYYYYATMRSSMANLITVLRIFAATVAFAWLLRPLGGHIWAFYWAAEILTALVFLSIAIIGTRRITGDFGITMMDETAFRLGKCINFTVACDSQAICEASEKIQEFCENNQFTQEQTMTISLAIEELMVIVSEKSMGGQGSMDVRVLRTPEGGILRIRSEGKRYNPLEFAKESLDYLGVDMIMKMAKKTEYQNTLGLNTLVVII